MGIVRLRTKNHGVDILIFIFSDSRREDKDDGVRTHRITGLLDFVHRPIFSTLENIMFRKWDLFSSSDERGDTYSIESFRKT
jgi:hypothetical protein